MDNNLANSKNRATCEVPETALSDREARSCDVVDTIGGGEDRASTENGTGADNGGSLDCHDPGKLSGVCIHTIDDAVDLTDKKGDNHSKMENEKHLGL